MERLLHALPQLRVIDEIEDLERPADLVAFPQGFLGWVLPRVVAELAHDGGLGHVLVRQRRQDALEVGPFLDHQIVERLTRRPAEEIAITAGMLESDPRGRFFLQIPVARRETVAKGVQNPKIDMVGAMRVGGMPLRLDFRAMVVQHVEPIMAFVLLRAEDLGVDRHVISHQGVATDPFLQPKIVGGMPRVDGMDLRFQALAVAAGVDGMLDVEQAESRPCRSCVADGVMGRVQRFQPQEIARCRCRPALKSRTAGY